MLGMKAENVGIIAMEIYFPKQYVDQAQLEIFDGASTGKYTIGLGQTKMAFCDDREDINSVCLTVVKNLMEKYNVDYNLIGRLEVGTETIIDKSKSVKSTLMQLFAQSGNTDIEGIDTTNACYGGTNALFNTINWMESTSWDGRYGLVVAGDIAVYASGNARPTGGCGVCALLVGPDAPIVMEQGVRSTHMEDVYDFYKPDLASEFPYVDGHLSNVCYLKSVDICYNRYIEKVEKRYGEKIDIETVPYFVFHTPYSKLVQKSFARLAFNDFIKDQENPKYAGLEDHKGKTLSETYYDKPLEKAFMAYTKEKFQKKVIPSLYIPKNCGNMYCGSVYSALTSLISQIPAEELLNKRVVLFSYGSGLAASMFSFKIKKSTAEIAKILNINERLESRNEVKPEDFAEIMSLREKTYQLKDYTPVSKSEIFPGTFYLKHIDDMYRRTYEIYQ